VRSASARNVEFLTPRGERAIRQADVVIGFETVVEFVSESVDGDALSPAGTPTKKALSAFADRVDAGGRNGGPDGGRTTRGYQFVGKVQRAVDARCRWFRASRRSRWRRVVRGRRWKASEFVTLHRAVTSNPIWHDSGTASATDTCSYSRDRTT